MFLDAQLTLIQQQLEDLQISQAVKSLESRLSELPTCYMSYLLLSQGYFKLGQFSKAVYVDKKAVQFDPLQQDFSNIQRLMQNKQLKHAAQSAQTMLNKIPNHPRAVFTLAHVFSLQGLFESETRVLTSGMQLSPANLLLRKKLVSSLQTAGYFASAIEHANILAKLDSSFETVWSLSTLHFKFGQYQQAHDLALKLIALTDEDATKLSKAYLLIGQILRVVGQRVSCIESFKNSIEQDHQNGEAWSALADMKNYRFTQKEINQLTNLSNEKSLSLTARCNMQFAYAKAIENSKDLKSAFSLYVKANNTKLTSLTPSKYFEKEFVSRKKSFTAHSLRATASKDKFPVTPIFIVGLPRSGSTLVEQILASHPQVEGTLEQPTMACIERETRELCLTKFGVDFFEGVSKLTHDDLNNLASSYYQKSQVFLTSKASYFTDKMPFNFRHIGLIYKILPNAIIVDVRRNALDCCLSLYKQHFTSGVDFAYNLELIGEFYNAYVDLMQHWNKVLTNRVFRVNYESLVRDTDNSISNLLKFSGLPDDPKCHTFYSNARPVHTASSEQVREPISAKSVGTWHSHIAELHTLAHTIKPSILIEQGIDINLFKGS